MIDLEDVSLLLYVKCNSLYAIKVDLEIVDSYL
jgi:hypothetical protein